MIIGIYIQKYIIDLNKRLEKALEKNDKLMKINKKLNDQIVEYKLNLIKENIK